MMVLRIRPGGLLLAALLIAGSTFAVAALGARADGPMVAAPAVLDLAVPADPDGLAARIGVWSAKVAADEHDYISATNLGILYLGRARLTGDLADYERSAAAVERALAADPEYLAARTLEAVVRYATHDFGGALEAASDVLADAPGQLDALAVVGDASLELGRPDAAGTTYARLTELAPGPAVDVRRARLALLSGDLGGAVDLARDARDGAIAEGLSDMAFYEIQLGEFGRLTGDAGLARRGFEAALALRPGDRAALVGLARVRAFEGDLGAAEALLRRAAEIAPEPATVALLGQVLALRGDAAGAAEQAELVRLTARLSELAGAVYDRELLLFELDHGAVSEELLARARSAAAARPDVAGRDIVAWALRRLGRSDEAWAVAEAALPTGAGDARLLYHAGAIAAARGDVTRATDLLGAALALGPALDPLQRRAAVDLLRPMTSPGS